MQFIGIEIAPAGTKAAVLDLGSPETLAETSVSHSWIDATDRIIREYLVDTLHPAGFI